MERLKEILGYPLFKIAGATVTLESITVGALVVVCTLLAAAVAGFGVRKLLERRGMSLGAQFAAAKIVRYAVMVIGVMLALSTVGVKLYALLAASTVVLVGVGFGLQNIAQNFISGIVLLIEQPVRKGDFIKVDDAYGVVDDIGLRATRVVTRDEVMMIVPNSLLIGHAVTNRSIPTSNMRIAVNVGVAYDTDPKLVKDVLLGVARASERVLHRPVPEVRFERFGDSTLEFALLVWIADPREDLRIASLLRFAIAAAFKEKDIAMPFPQREIHLGAGFEKLARRDEKG
jgi:small-conductance mechanosensitive channel